MLSPGLGLFERAALEDLREEIMLPDDLWPVSINDHVIEPGDLWTKRVRRSS